MSTPDVEECGVERRRLVDVFSRLIDYYRLFQLLSRMFSLSKRSPIEALELSRGLGQILLNFFTPVKDWTIS